MKTNGSDVKLKSDFKKIPESNCLKKEHDMENSSKSKNVIKTEK